MIKNYNKVKVMYESNIKKKPNKKWILPVIIFLAVFVAYSPSLRNNFVADDVDIIKNNEYIVNFNNVFKIPTKDYFRISKENSYRPLATLSYYTLYQFLKFNSAGYHLNSILIHSFNAILVFLIINFLINNIGIALLTGLLFALHPVLGEAIYSITFNEDLLFSFFLFISFFFYIKNDKKLKRSAGYNILSNLGYIFALFCKEAAIVYPLLIFIYDYLFGRLYQKEKFKNQNIILVIFQKYISYLVVTIIYLFIRFYIFKSPPEMAQDSFFTGTFLERILTILTVFTTYIKLSLFPVRLCTPYDNYSIAKSLLELRVIISIIVLLGLGVITWNIRNKFKYIYFFVLWFLIALLPTSNIINVGVWLAERYLYLALIGFCFILAFILNQIKNEKLLITVSGIILLFYMSQDVINSFTWRDDMTLWTTMEVRWPQTTYPRRELADIYAKEGKIEKAIDEYKKVLEIVPNYLEGLNRLGNLYKQLREYDKSLNEFQKALNLNPEHLNSHNNLGVLYAEMGKSNEAIIEFQKVLELNPNYVEAYNNLGNLWASKKEYAKAIPAFKKALELNPNFLRGYYNLGVLYSNMKDYPNAIIQFKKAEEMNPSIPEIHSNLGYIYYYQKEYIKALQEFEYLLRLDPNNKNAQSKIEMLKKLIK